MVARRFVEGEKFQWQDRGWIVERRLQTGKVVIQQIMTGVTETYELTQLEQALFDGQLAFHVGGRQAHNPNEMDVTTRHRYITLDDCPEHLAQEARLRYAFTKPLWEMKPGQRTDAYLEKYIDQFWARLTPQERIILESPISVRTARRWIKMLTDSDGDLRGLISNLSNSGGSGKPRLASPLEEIIAEVFDELYLVRTPHSITEIHDEICKRIDEENQGKLEVEQLPSPSRATVARRIKNLDRSRVISYQKGRKAGKQATQQFGLFSVPELPNQRWEIDGTVTDILVVDPVDNLPIGRMTLVTCIDVCTKVIVGISIHYGESYFAVAECLFNAIQKGPSTREKYGTVNEVNLYGLPETLVIDRGRALKNQHLLDACTLLGIDLVPTQPGHPQGKPFVERFMGTISKQVFHVAPGTTFSNVRKRGSYDSEKQACLYLDDLERAIYLFVADIYSQDSHSGLGGRTPAQVLDEFCRDGFEPRLPPSSEELSILLGQVLYRTLDKNGFTFERLRYNHAALGVLRARLGGRGRIKIKYHADDLGQMYVYDPFENQYIQVPAVDQDYAAGLSLWKHRTIVNFANKEAKGINRLALAEARRELRKIFEGSRERKRASRYKQSRSASWRKPGRPKQDSNYVEDAKWDHATQAQIDAIFEMNERKTQLWAAEIYGDDDIASSETEKPE